MLNKTYLAMLMEAGLDGAILDPTDTEWVATALAARALLGRDEFRLEYVQAGRTGR